MMKNNSYLIELLESTFKTVGIIGITLVIFGLILLFNNDPNGRMVCFAGFGVLLVSGMAWGSVHTYKVVKRVNDERENSQKK